jgi:hypothetical protein
MYVKGNDPCWLGLNTPEMQYWAYVFCSPLGAVIDRCAEADINGEIQLLKNNGTDDFSNAQPARRMKKLLKKPNPLQTWEEFRGQQVVFKKVFGYVPVFSMIPSGFDDATFASYLWNLNPYYVKPFKNQSFTYITEITLSKSGLSL